MNKDTYLSTTTGMKITSHLNLYLLNLCLTWIPQGKDLWNLLWA